MTNCDRKSPSIVGCAVINPDSEGTCLTDMKIKQPSFQRRVQIKVGATYCWQEPDRSDVFLLRGPLSDDYSTPRNGP